MPSLHPTSKEKPLPKRQSPPKTKAEAQARNVKAARVAKPSKPNVYRGEDNGHAKLTNKQALEIIKCLKRYRVLREEMKITSPLALSKRFGVTENTIRDIDYGRSWNHLSKFQK